MIRVLGFCLKTLGERPGGLRGNVSEKLGFQNPKTPGAPSVVFMVKPASGPGEAMQKFSENQAVRLSAVHGF